MKGCSNSKADHINQEGTGANMDAIRISGLLTIVLSIAACSNTSERLGGSSLSGERKSSDGRSGRNPATICIESETVAVVIEEKSKTVSRFVDLERQTKEKILGSSLRMIETNPPILQTTYELKDSRELVVEYQHGVSKGTGYMTTPDKETVHYSLCWEKDNFKLSEGL